MRYPLEKMINQPIFPLIFGNQKRLYWLFRDAKTLDVPAMKIGLPTTGGKALYPVGFTQH